MTLEAVFLFCALAAPADCIEKRAPISPEGMTPYSCALHGQQMAADLLREHPGYRLARWGCNRVAEQPA